MELPRELQREILDFESKVVDSLGSFAALVRRAEEGGKTAAQAFKEDTLGVIDSLVLKERVHHNVRADVNALRKRHLLRPYQFFLDFGLPSKDFTALLRKVLQNAPKEVAYDMIRAALFAQRARHRHVLSPPMLTMKSLGLPADMLYSLEANERALWKPSDVVNAAKALEINLSISTGDVRHQCVQSQELRESPDHAEPIPDDMITPPTASRAHDETAEEYSALGEQRGSSGVSESLARDGTGWTALDNQVYNHAVDDEDDFAGSDRGDHEEDEAIDKTEASIEQGRRAPGLFANHDVSSPLSLHICGSYQLPTPTFVPEETSQSPPADSMTHVTQRNRKRGIDTEAEQRPQKAAKITGEAAHTQQAQHAEELGTQQPDSRSSPPSTIIYEPSGPSRKRHHHSFKDIDNEGHCPDLREPRERTSELSPDMPSNIERASPKRLSPQEPAIVSCSRSTASASLPEESNACQPFIMSTSMSGHRDVGVQGVEYVDVPDDDSPTKASTRVSALPAGEVAAKMLQSTMPCRWLNDSAIMYALQCFIPSASQWDIVDTHTIRVDDPEANAQGCTTDRSLQARHDVVAPLHLNGNHWCIAVILRKNGTDGIVHLLDPKQDPTQLSRCETALKKQLLPALDEQDDLVETRVWQFQISPLRQSDACNCGVFSLMFAICHMNHCSPPEAFSPNIWRRAICAALRQFCELDVPLASLDEVLQQDRQAPPSAVDNITTDPDAAMLQFKLTLQYSHRVTKAQVEAYDVCDDNSHTILDLCNGLYEERTAVLGALRRELRMFGLSEPSPSQTPALRALETVKNLMLKDITTISRRRRALSRTNARTAIMTDLVRQCQD